MNYTKCLDIDCDFSFHSVTSAAEKFLVRYGVQPNIVYVAPGDWNIVGKVAELVNRDARWFPAFEVAPSLPRDAWCVGFLRGSEYEYFGSPGA